MKNSVSFLDQKTQRLDFALKFLLDALESCISKNKLTDEEALGLKKVILETYLQRKAGFYLQDKSAEISHKIQNTLNRIQLKSSSFSNI